MFLFYIIKKKSKQLKTRMEREKEKILYEIFAIIFFGESSERKPAVDSQFSKDKIKRR